MSTDPVFDAVAEVLGLLLTRALTNVLIDDADLIYTEASDQLAFVHHNLLEAAVAYQSGRDFVPTLLPSPFGLILDREYASRVPATPYLGSVDLPALDETMPPTPRPAHATLPALAPVQQGSHIFHAAPIAQTPVQAALGIVLNPRRAPVGEGGLLTPPPSPVLQAAWLPIHALTLVAPAHTHTISAPDNHFPVLTQGYVPRGPHSFTEEHNSSTY